MRYVVSSETRLARNGSQSPTESIDVEFPIHRLRLNRVDIRRSHPRNRRSIFHRDSSSDIVERFLVHVEVATAMLLRWIRPTMRLEPQQRLWFHQVRDSNRQSQGSRPPHSSRQFCDLRELLL